jgi:hypothetical protein
MVVNPRHHRIAGRRVSCIGHRRLASGFASGAEVEDRGFSGLFLGTCSPLAYAALYRVAPRTRPVTSPFNRS